MNAITLLAMGCLATGSILILWQIRSKESLRLSSLSQETRSTKHKKAFIDYSLGSNHLLAIRSLFNFNNKGSNICSLPCILIIVLSGTVGAYLGAGKSPLASLFGAAIGIYAALILCWSIFAQQKKHYHRKVLFFLPLTLESLILLVETGLGLLPSIQTIVEANKHQKYPNPVIEIFAEIYRRTSNGAELSVALESIAHSCDIPTLRHVLLHLDLTGSEGGELVPALRTLSAHTHTEWRLSVEQRVRRLENFVVFPVFASVIGLLLLTAAVPLVPLLELRATLKRPAITTVQSSPESF